MSKPLLRHGIWYAVCDSQHALLLENEGDVQYPKLETRDYFKQDNPPTHEQGSAPPGRVFSSADGHRAATVESDFHQQQAESFLQNFAELLGQRVQEGRIRSLVLVAPARALGILRSHLSEAARRIVMAEIDHDYVKMPLYEIERRLAALQR